MSSRLEQLHRVAAARASTVSLAGGLPAAELLPREALAAATAVALPSPATDALQYGWPEGDLAIRTWVAERLKARGAPIGPDDVVVTAGAQQALSLIAAVWPAGTRVAVDAETYPAAIETFTLAGHPLVVDDDAGLRYLIDGVHNPHGVDRLAPRREALLAAGRPLVVDEAYVELRFDGRIPRPMYADAPDRVWHVGSFSKIVGPGLRVGWLVPPRDRKEDVLAHKRAADLQTATFPQAVLARWLASADYDDLVERARNLYRARAERLCASLARRLPSWRALEPEGGLSVWVETDLGGDDVAFLATAVAQGVAFDPGSMFRASPASGQPIAMRLSFSHAPFDQLDLAVRRLERAARSFRRARDAHAA
ncbi:MAG TPA: PLP-dependent aminotransferase family protein [Kofleriaceae bacterium]|nr:PLP-dependent aminotransferase family protein [Kofleriaceae bacterium]